MKKVTSLVVTQKECLGKDEIWCNWYECPGCNFLEVLPHSKYCSHCGISLVWRLEEDKK